MAQQPEDIELLEKASLPINCYIANIIVFCSELEQSLAGYKYIAQNIYEKLILINIRFKTGSELNVVFTGNKYV